MLTLDEVNTLTDDELRARLIALGCSASYADEVIAHERGFGDTFFLRDDGTVTDGDGKVVDHVAQ